MKFASDIYRAANIKINDNLILSPIGIQTAMGTVLTGSLGETREEISRALSLDESVEDKIEANNKVGLGSDIYICNGIFAQINNNISVEFIKNVEKCKGYYKSIDFGEDNLSTRVINELISLKTNYKINHFIHNENMDEDTRLIVTNAIHFKSYWNKPFNKDNTNYLEFHGMKVKSRVGMMRQTNDFPIARYRHFDVLFMPYINDFVCFVIVLPHDLRGLPNIENNLDLDKILTNSNVERVSLMIPRFNIEAKSKLTDAFQKMGIIKAFSDSAEFDIIDNCKISEIIHKTLVNVTEEGTDYSAAKPIGSSYTGSRDAYVFNVDHPFAFFVINNRTSDILFEGRITDI